MKFNNKNKTKGRWMAISAYISRIDVEYYGNVIQNAVLLVRESVEIQEACWNTGGNIYG